MCRLVLADKYDYVLMAMTPAAIPLMGRQALLDGFGFIEPPRAPEPKATQGLRNPNKEGIGYRMGTLFFGLVAGAVVIWFLFALRKRKSRRSRP